MRNIRESPIFQKQCVDLGLSIRRLDEVREMFEWALSTSPTSFDEVPGTNMRLIITTPFPGLPALRIFFEIADIDFIDLVWIEKIEEDPTEPTG